VEPVSLARLEFALTVVFHYLLVALTLGLVLLVAITHTRWVRTGKPVFEKMTRYWGLAYLINYAVGIGAGIAMEFQLGMNWSGLENAAASVVGAPLSVETVVAFFAESTFLALWIFGFKRLSKGWHLALIWLTALAAYMSAIWALVANGFMHHPEGFTQEPGKVLQLNSISSLFFNSNSWIAIGHIVPGAVLTGGFFMLGVSGILKKRGNADEEFIRRSMRTGAHAALWGVLGVIGMGMLQLDLVTKQQPVKFAAFINSQSKLAVFAKQLQAQFGTVDMPPGVLVRYSALTMMGCAAVMLIFAIWIFIATRGGRVIKNKALLWLLPVILLFPYIANAAGWVFREVGRQPYIIYDILSTNEALTPSLTTGGLTVSLIVFVVLIGTLLGLDWFLLGKLARRGPNQTIDLWQSAEDSEGPEGPADKDDDSKAVLV
jgi:cytochrome bd ubiquinol oxidase subunit I